MSLQTWKAKFYPTKPTKKMTKREAIEHSIRKWEGIRKSNLKKHGLEQEIFEIVEREGSYRFSIDVESCALCKKYYSSAYEIVDDVVVYDFERKCSECPLRQVLGHPCDFSSDAEYGTWMWTGNPVPMIKALKQALKQVKDEE